MSIRERIIGIDPGYRVTGYGVVESCGQQLRYLDSGVLKLPESDVGSRIYKVFDGLSKVLREQPLQVFALEDIFVSKDPRAALKLGMVRGAAICAAVHSGLPVSEYSPRFVKKALTGNGNANKSQVKYMVARLLKITAPPSDDESDALAVAICQAFFGATARRLKTS